MTNLTKQPKPKRRWLRFSLRSFLIGITFFGVVVGPYIYRAEKQRAAVKWIKENGGIANYAYELGANGLPVASRQPFGPTWLHDILGVDYFSSVVAVTFLMRPVSDLNQLASLTKLEVLILTFAPIEDLKPLAGLARLEQLYLIKTQVSDLSPLSGLTKLEHLDLSETNVSNLLPLSGLTKLEHLKLWGTEVSDGDIEKLQRALPNCIIYH